MRCAQPHVPPASYWPLRPVMPRMPRPFAYPLLAATALLSLGCPESEAQRGRDALKQVAGLHRELLACHRRHAQAFAAGLDGQGRTEPLWVQSPLADVDGRLVSKALLLSYLDLETRSAPRDLPANARAYVAFRAGVARSAAEALERNPGDPATLDGRIRAASLAMWREDEALAQKYLAALNGR